MHAGGQAPVGWGLGGRHVQWSARRRPGPRQDPALRWREPKLASGAKCDPGR